LEEKVAAPIYKAENTAVGIRQADQVAPYIRKKLALTSPTSGSPVGIVRSRTQATEFSFSSESQNEDATKVLLFRLNISNEMKARITPYEVLALTAKTKYSPFFLSVYVWRTQMKDPLLTTLEYLINILRKPSHS
jgi:hypothetical protein